VTSLQKYSEQKKVCPECPGLDQIRINDISGLTPKEQKTEKDA
jgi:hypothetical protein